MDNTPIGLAYFSISIACTSVILAFHSVELGNISSEISIESRDISEESKEIANESKDMMEANANESFLRIFDTFEDGRILYLNQIRKGDLHLTEEIAWKCTTYMKRAFDLMKHSNIDEENRKLLFNQYNLLLGQFPWQGKIIDGFFIKGNVITLTDVQNLFNVYKEIRKNRLYDKDKDKPIQFFDPYKGDIDYKKTVDEQIDRFLKEIKETKKILKELRGEQRRYPFMRLEQAKQLLAKKK